MCGLSSPPPRDHVMPNPSSRYRPLAGRTLEFSGQGPAIEPALEGSAVDSVGCLPGDLARQALFFFAAQIISCKKNTQAPFCVFRSTPRSNRVEKMSRRRAVSHGARRVEGRGRLSAFLALLVECVGELARLQVGCWKCGGCRGMRRGFQIIKLIKRVLYFVLLH